MAATTPLPCPGAVNFTVGKDSSANPDFVVVSTKGIQDPARRVFPFSFQAATGGSLLTIARIDTANNRLHCDLKPAATTSLPEIVMERTLPSASTCTASSAIPAVITCRKSGTTTLTVPSFSCPLLWTTPQGAQSFTTQHTGFYFNKGLSYPSGTASTKVTCRYVPLPQDNLISNNKILSLSRPKPNDGKTYTLNSAGTGFIVTDGPTAFTVEAESMTKSTGGATAGGWNLWSNGTLSATKAFVAGKAYRVQVVAKATLAQNVGANMRLSIGGANMGAVEVRKTQFDPSAPYEFTITAPRPGNVAVGTEVQLSIVITFDNDLQTSTEDRNLLVDKIIVTPR